MYTNKVKSTFLLIFLWCGAFLFRHKLISLTIMDVVLGFLFVDVCDLFIISSYSISNTYLILNPEANLKFSQEGNTILFWGYM